MQPSVLIAAASVLLAAAPSVLSSQIQGERGRTGRLEADFAPPIDLWLDQVSYDRGATMRPFFSTEPGAYVVVVRVASNGELRVMYPIRPNDQAPYFLGQFTNDRVPSSMDPSLNLLEPTGTGMVFAIASYARFDLKKFSQGNRWNTARLASFGRNGDPFQVVREFVDVILPETAEFSLDYEVYEVYSRNGRGAYATNGYGGGLYGRHFGYSSLIDYYDACQTAFGVRYTSYCRSYRGGYYGPIIIADPVSPPRPSGGKRMKAPRPVVPDPIVPAQPTVAEGRVAGDDVEERSARERYERMNRKVAPRDVSPPVVRSAPEDRTRRSDPQERAPVIHRAAPPRTTAPAPQPRSEPRPAPAPRVEGTQAPRPTERRAEPMREKSQRKESGKQDERKSAIVRNSPQ